MIRGGKGFTLIELLIALAIIATLVGIAYPRYTGHVKRTYRAEIVGMLTEQAQHLERYYTKNGTFIDAGGISAGNDRYRIAVTLNLQHFNLVATPIIDSVMMGDPCGDFSLSSSGERSNPGSAPDMSRKACWGQ
ncbi:prepilin-type N-terminal cleavage/methylation domain-containing protein [Pseudomonas sp. CCM 7891]|uniref:Prepilin-type N-terminal cleavage/methylation domain-containing protein n=1 Tax=Pseudomonas karstica TaxID=1055468 RepID=A0A7X2V089_9PSED|nr:type IV pilin protein [Pseudomonas karstica]MTD20925.1 prepilin-type N-terminal cleavage/methylation domain-containing protein [Pseudomonas karstica]